MNRRNFVKTLTALSVLPLAAKVQPEGSAANYTLSHVSDLTAQQKKDFRALAAYWRETQEKSMASVMNRAFTPTQDFVSFRGIEFSQGT